MNGSVQVSAPKASSSVPREDPDGSNTIPPAFRFIGREGQCVRERECVYVRETACVRERVIKREDPDGIPRPPSR